MSNSIRALLAARNDDVNKSTTRPLNPVAAAETAIWLGVFGLLPFCTKDGWWLLRASNTQPVLVARCEAADNADLERLMTDLKAALAACGVELPDDASSGHH